MYQECQFTHCKVQFNPDGRKRFCSRRCANLSRWNADTDAGRTIRKTCENCGKSWTTTRTDDNRRASKTCSDTCRNDQIRKKHKGRIFSKESRVKMSQAQKGKTQTEEHRTNIGKGVSGSKNRFWKDGRSYDKDCYDGMFTETLKTTVKRRDNNSCQECQCATQRNLHVHHIVGNKQNNLIDNLISLCQRCHSIIHHTKDYVPSNTKIRSLS